MKVCLALTDIGSIRAMLSLEASESLPLHVNRKQNYRVHPGRKVKEQK